MTTAATFLRLGSPSAPHSDERQAVDAMAAYLSRRGWKARARFTEATRADDRRDGLRRLLTAARDRCFDVVVVYRADHLVRSAHELVVVVHDLHELGVGFASVTEPFDTTSTSFSLVDFAQAFIAFEKRAHLASSARGIAAARRRGTKLGRPRRASPAHVMRLLARGYSVRRIADELGCGIASAQRAIEAARSENPLADPRPGRRRA